MTTTTTQPQQRKNLDFINDDLEYLPHQIDGVRWLSRRTSFLLCDEMGLGKTLQALTAVAVDFQRGWASRFITVVPATLKGNWEEEVHKHTSFKVMVLDGPPKKRAQQLDEFDDPEQGYHGLIVNYEQLPAHLNDFNSMRFDIAIYDEAHYLKNPSAKRTRAAQALQAKRHFVLTGSPMLNHVNDLWSLLHRVAPEEFPNYYRFRNRYCIYGGYKNKQIVGVKNTAELRDRLNHFMLRRLKKNVLDLPDKHHIQVYVDLHPQQRKIYTEVDKEMKLTLPNNPDPMEIENALVKFTRLKEICGTTASFEGMEDHSYKLDRAMEMIEEITQESEEHVVVFTQFRAVLKALGNRMAASKTIEAPFSAIHGDVAANQRMPLVRDWRDGPPGVLALMLQVGGQGLNLTAANKCIFLDKLFVPKLNEQAEDRLHRIGTNTTQPVQIYEIIARKTIEQRIEAILRQKATVFGQIVDSNELKRKLIQALKEEEGEDE